MVQPTVPPAVNPFAHSLTSRSLPFPLVPAASPATKPEMRILIVEDDRKTRELLTKGLREEGFTVDAVGDGAAGLAAAEDYRFDLIILDIMMPGWDGWTTLAALRAQKIDTPVLFLTARDSIPDRVKGLELGADDYLVKPFAWSEFLARLRNILRRQLSASTSPIAIKGDTLLVIGDLEIDLISMKARRAGKLIDLTAKEFQLLAYLARRTGQVLSRTTLAEQVWDMNFSTDSNAVDVAMGRLRKKLDDGHTLKLIHTRRGLGFLLEATR